MEWEFEDFFWEEISPAGIKFNGFLDGKRYVFFVSRIAINDYYQTTDSREQLVANFEENRDHINNVAANYADDSEADDESPHYVITSDDFAEYA